MTGLSEDPISKEEAEKLGAAIKALGDFIHAKHWPDNHRDLSIGRFRELVENYAKALPEGFIASTHEIAFNQLIKDVPRQMGLSPGIEAYLQVRDIDADVAANPLVDAAYKAVLDNEKAARRPPTPAAGVQGGGAPTAG